MRSAIVGTLLAFALFTAAPLAQADFTGAWALSFTTPNGAMDASATFKQDGDALSGTMSSARGDVPFKGTAKGKSFTVMIEVETPDGPMSIKIVGERDGDSMKGTFDFGQGMGDWTGKRTK